MDEGVLLCFEDEADDAEGIGSWSAKNPVPLNSSPCSLKVLI